MTTRNELIYSIRSIIGDDEPSGFFTKVQNGKEVYNCTKCLNEYVLTYKKKGDIFACKYDDNNMPTFLHILLCKNHI